MTPPPSCGTCAPRRCGDADVFRAYLEMMLMLAPPREIFFRLGLRRRSPPPLPEAILADLRPVVRAEALKMLS